jgi:hypothetical protein
LSKGITIFPFFGVLKDKATMAQSEGLVVVCRLEVLQRFEDLHSPMNIGVMHVIKAIGNNEERKEITARRHKILTWKTLSNNER